MSKPLHPIPPDILKDPDNKWRKVSLMDVLTLLRHIHEGARHPKVGFLDANETLDSMTRKLNRTIWVRQSWIESGLWSCNLMDEAGQFMDYRGRTLDQYLKDVLGQDEFNKFWNLVETKESK